MILNKVRQTVYKPEQPGSNMPTPELKKIILGKKKKIPHICQAQYL